MADQELTEPVPPNANLYTELDYLPVPPLDPAFFSDDLSLSEKFISGELTLSENFISDLGFEDGDFDFSFDDLYLPSETEDFLITDGSSEPDGSDSVQASGDQSSDDVRVPDCPSPESGGRDREVSGDRSSSGDRVLNSRSPELCQVSGNQSSDVPRVLNLPSPEGGSCNQEFSNFPSPDSADRGSDIATVLNYPSPKSGTCNQEFSGPASSQGSGNCGSGVSEALNYQSPVDSGNCDRSVPSSPNFPNNSSNIVVDQKVKLEEVGKNCLPKRKKEHEDGNIESRSIKFRRSIAIDNANPPYGFNAPNEEEEKKKARLMRNRESAQLSRQRKKHYVDELEDKLRSMHSTIAELNSKISYIMAENASLRQQLGGGGMCPPPPGMYPHPPMAPMGYPWVPCAPYVVKPQGSQVPLVPIPRLKPQQPKSASRPKKAESKKTEGKTKKVASISFLGLLFFILLFGGLVPIVNVKYGGIENKISGASYISDPFNVKPRGRILTVNGGHLNGSDQSMGVGLSNGKFDITNRIHCEGGRIGGAESDVEQKERGSQTLPGSDGFVRLGNDSEPLVASLYVPRNDKLVKIDGNLIIHSVLASEKAMASRAAPGMKNNRETGLAIAGNLVPALAISEVGRNKGKHPRLYRNPTKRQKALTSGSADTVNDNLKSTATDGKLQQWFREGLAGPMLSSGMCTEVVQFDVSPASAPGVIISASPVTNISAEHRQNSTHLKKGRNRRILRGLPIPFPGSTLNITEEHVGRSSKKDNFPGNKSVSSMVVSVLVDPREVGDSDGDGMIRPKSLSRIFVVVLLDSVKYVTYSCVLPLKGSGPHLVTT